MHTPVHPVAKLFARAAFPLAPFLPLRLATGLAALVCGGFARRFVRERTIRANIRTAFPDIDERTLIRTTRRIAGNFGRVSAELAHVDSFATSRGGARLRAEGALELPLQQRRQAVYLTAHLGNWELIPLLFRDHTPPLTVIYDETGDPFIDRHLMALRRRTGADYAERDRAERACLAAMKAGASAGFLLDQPVDRGVMIDFFGEPTLFTPLPARLAIRFRCPMVYVESRRTTPGEIAVTFHEPIWPGSERGRSAEAELTQRLARMAEESIRAAPAAWICNEPRWPGSNPALELWHRVYDSFRYHNQGGKDRTPLVSLNRIFRKVAARSPTPLPELIPEGCSIEVATIGLDALAGLRRYHGRSSPKRSSTMPLIAVAHDGDLFVVDGHNRLNRQLSRGHPDSAEVIVIRPFGKQR